MEGFERVVQAIERIRPETLVFLQPKRRIAHGARIELTHVLASHLRLHDETSTLEVRKVFGDGLL